VRVAIVGPGALGCLFGGLLALAGNDVRLLARRADQAESLRRDGVTIERDGAVRHAEVDAGTDPTRLGPVDLAIVLVKAGDTTAAATALPALLAPDGAALSLQNGLGNVERLVDVLGTERVLGGVTAQGATLLATGRVRHAGFGPSVLAEAAGLPAGDAPSDRARTIAGRLDAAGIPAQAGDAVGPLVWGKLVANVGINPLGALLGCSNGALVEGGETNELLAGLADEAAAVARAAGIALPFDDPAEHVRRVALQTAANRNSMLQDIEAKRPTEIGALNEAVATLGARLGVPTPLNQTMALLIRALVGTYAHL
jgi:2-dehydropantoate 2-reductase